MATDERVALAAEAFIYGFPLVFDLEQVDRFVRDTPGSSRALSRSRQQKGALAAVCLSRTTRLHRTSFLERLRVWMQAFPPAQRDRAYQERFESLGLFEQESPYLDPDAGLLPALREGLTQGQQLMEGALRNTPGQQQNGWNLTYHVFDYDLDLHATCFDSRGPRP